MSFHSYWQTFARLYSGLGTFFETLRLDGSTWPALAFAWIAKGVCYFMASALTIGFLAIWIAIQHQRLSPSGSGPVGIEAFLNAQFLMPIVTFAILTLFAPAGLFLRAAVYHGVLRLLSSTQQPFLATFRAVAYAHGGSAPAWLLTIIPVPAFNFLLWLIWETAFDVVAVMKSQETSVGTALAAVLIPVLAVLMLTCAVFVGMIVRAMSFVR
jgi:hypothetical protein